MASAERKQRTRSLRPLLVAIAAMALARQTAADEWHTGAMVWTDGDGTTVLSPEVGGTATGLEGRARVDVRYTADIWTSASVDIRTAATKPVTEQRDQIDLALAYDFTDVEVGTSYYFSHESDYVAHAGSLFATTRLGDGSATLETRASLGLDTIGRSGDPNFEREATNVSGRIALTQAIDPETLVQVAYEVAHRRGYQSSPYRFVGLGGDGRCGGTAALCIPEAHPALKTRHAAALQLRRALGREASIGAAYRFYIDDWGVTSHTASAQLAILPTEDSLLALRYRFYLQTAADFYRASYPALENVRHVTRDRELSPMSSNRIALHVEQRFGSVGFAEELRGALAVGGTVLSYRNFVGLDQVYALDVTASVEADL